MLTRYPRLSRSLNYTCDQLSTKKVNLTISSMLVIFFSSAHATEIEKIQVTAQHRVQNIQQVPIAITALSTVDIERSDIYDASSVASYIPSMTYSEFSPGQANISIRGINTSDDGAGLDNSVALFLDGVYIGRRASINFDMFDLERIEVLRGPQGTLFGRNSIGGAISVITAKPTADYNAKIGLTTGNYGIIRYQGLINGALSDDISAKISINHRENDGFVHNVILNKDQKDENQTSLRTQISYKKNDTQWLFSADYMDDDREDMGRIPVINGNQDYINELKNLGADGAFETAAPVDGFSKRKASGISLTGTVDFVSGSFITISAIRQAKTDWEMASIGAPLITATGPTYNFGDNSTSSDDVYGIDVIDDVNEDIKTLSQEFRWSSDINDEFNYTTGLFFLTEKTDRSEQFNTSLNSNANPQQKLGNEYTRASNKTTSYAVYGQGTLTLDEQWSISAGARYTIDKKDYSATAVNCALDLTGTAFENIPDCVGVGGSLGLIAEAFTINTDDSWSNFSPMANLSYQASDNLMLFSSVSRGFKSGGFAGAQGVKLSASVPIAPEIATNYELGFRGDFFDKSLRFNSTVYYTDYEDLQVARFGPTQGSDFGTFQTTNVGEADINGLEVEFNWNISDDINLSGNYAYLDTQVNNLAFETAAGLVDGSGNPLRMAPRNSYHVMLNYFVPINMGEIDFRLEYSHTDEQNMDLIDTSVQIDESDLFDAKATWLSSNDNIELALWVKNIANKAYIVHTYIIGPGVIGVWGEPRTYGMSATYKF